MWDSVHSLISSVKWAIQPTGCCLIKLLLWSFRSAVSCRLSAKRVSTLELDFKEKKWLEYDPSKPPSSHRNHIVKTNPDDKHGKKLPTSRVYNYVIKLMTMELRSSCRVRYDRDFFDLTEITEPRLNEQANRNRRITECCLYFRKTIESLRLFFPTPRDLLSLVT